jgi:predicted dehydrogenase
LKVGVVGLGRLGKVYVRDLAGRIPETAVVAVADSDHALAVRIADQFDVPKAYGSAQELIADRDVEAVIVVSPTSTHVEIVIAATQSKKPTFC